MCTVSYLPTENGDIITSNRDEAPARHAVTVIEVSINDRRVFFPRDPHAGGTTRGAKRPRVIAQGDRR